MMSNFTKLIGAESLGFYNCCEVTTIFLYDKKMRSTHNVFTIFVFEERIEALEKEKEYLMPKPKMVTKNYSVGICQEIVDIEKAKQYYNTLRDNVKNKNIIQLDDEPLNAGELEEVPPVFVPIDSTVESPLNKVLKNNFNNGSYILEFFDIEKPLLKILNHEKLNILYDAIHEVIPIDLQTISDRLGNFVFQFPSLNINMDFRTYNEENSIYYRIQLDQRLLNLENYHLMVELISDKTIVGFATTKILANYFEKELEVGDATKLCRTTLYDAKNQIVLARQESTFMRSLNLNGRLNSGYREIYNGTQKDRVELFSRFNMGKIGSKNVLYREEWINKRKYNLRVQDVIKKQEFRRYGFETSLDHDNAIKDIIGLMQKVEVGMVYLWDPYLSAEDLLKTWYYTDTFYIPFHVITSSEAAKAAKDNVRDWINQQRECLTNSSNQIGINLEVRCQFENHGFKFHDRFLMIVSKNESPKVWSLGTSINGLGKKHHIIQRVSHPQMVVDAFEDLWDKLSAEECLVWKQEIKK